jgi:hypothetical protein
MRTGQGGAGSNGDRTAREFISAETDLQLAGRSYGVSSLLACFFDVYNLGLCAS